MIDNIELIKPLLTFESKDEFYYLQVIRRKKDLPDKVRGSNNSSRLVKSYFINSVEYLEERYDEIKKLCEVFEARAMINLNVRSYEKIAYQNMETIADCMINKSFNKMHRNYDTTVGRSSTTRKKWIIDIDYDKEGCTDYDFVYKLANTIMECKPYVVDKIIDLIPSKNGMHIITNSSDIGELITKFRLATIAGIQEDNPTNLYIP